MRDTISREAQTAQLRLLAAIMWRTPLGWFVVVHGLLTISIWSSNPRTVEGSAPMDTSRSWLLGDARTVISAVLVVAAFRAGIPA